MGWYVAGSLNQLLSQLNARFPNRSKVSDGSIGDASHSARESDHNPTASGQVCARDFTNDPAPATGLHGQWLADALVAGRDPRIKYVIWNHRIIDSRAGSHPWTWMPYNGKNAHEHHVHVSVFAGALGDDTRPWILGGTSGGDDDMQLSDTVDLFGDETDTSVNNVLAGIFTRMDKVYDLLTQETLASKVKDSNFRALPAEFWRNADFYGYENRKQLDALAAGQAETNRQLAKLVELLTSTKDGA